MDWDDDETVYFISKNKDLYKFEEENDEAMLIRSGFGSATNFI
jgi:hypothetical protein